MEQTLGKESPILSLIHSLNSHRVLTVCRGNFPTRQVKMWSENLSHVLTTLEALLLLLHLSVKLIFTARG